MLSPLVGGLIVGRAFTGAWIETTKVEATMKPNNGRAFTGAWIETYPSPAPPSALGRAFTGAWIETPQWWPKCWLGTSRLHGRVD